MARRARWRSYSMLEINTFSISARCGRTGMLGVAVSTAVPGVGGICPFVEAGIGAISTQSWVNPYLGIDGLALLRTGKDCTGWFGHRTGAGFAIQGNMLVGEATVEAMTVAFSESEPLSLPERL